MKRLKEGFDYHRDEMIPDSPGIPGVLATIGILIWGIPLLRNGIGQLYDAHTKGTITKVEVHKKTY